MHQWKKSIFPAGMLLVLLLFDGLIASYFNQVLYTSLGYVTPRLTIVGLMLLSLYLSKGHLLTLTLIFGFLYDSYFTGFFGYLFRGRMSHGVPHLSTAPLCEAEFGCIFNRGYINVNRHGIVCV